MDVRRLKQNVAAALSAPNLRDPAVNAHPTMSTVRRRIFGSSDDARSSSKHDSSSRDESPVPTITDSGKDYKVLSAQKYAELKEKPKKVAGAKRRHFWMFTLGGIVGVVLAGIFAGKSGGFDRLVTFAGLEGMSLDSFIDILPAGLIRDVQDLQVSLSTRKQAIARTFLAYRADG